jgi:hypothetical protein
MATFLLTWASLLATMTASVDAPANAMAFPASTRPRRLTMAIVNDNNPHDARLHETRGQLFFSRGGTRMLEKFDPNDPDAMKHIRTLFSPQMVDQEIRQAIHVCWMGLPADKRTVDEVDKQIRRVVDRALRDLREDADAFDFGERTP